LRNYGKMLITLIFILAMGAINFLGNSEDVWAEGQCGAKWEGIPTITMKLRDGSKGVTVGVGDVEKYHNGGQGIGPGVALGYRACQIAFANLYAGEIPPRGDQFVVCGTPKDCPGDAVTYITGARYGKGSEGAFNGNLVFDQSIGSFFNFIFVSMSTGKAVKLVCKFQFPKEFVESKSNTQNDPKAKEKASEISSRLVRTVLTAPAGELFDVISMPEFSWKTYKEKK
jgi:formylmethanofuran dehydrogenase subunit E